MGERPQEIINRLVIKSDILVAIFWFKLGSPTGVAASGTIEEIEKHLGAKKPTMIYFSNALLPHDFDTKQFEYVRALRQKYESEGLIGEFANSEEFRTVFTQDLRARMVEYLKVERPNDALRVSMGNDLKGLGTLSAIAEKVPWESIKASWEILSKNVIETAKLFGFKHVEGERSDLSQAVHYLSLYVLESQEFMVDMYALKTELQKVEKTSNAEDAQVFVRSCMTVLRRLLLYLEGER
jgi:hypothetical protein